MIISTQATQTEDQVDQALAKKIRFLEKLLSEKEKSIDENAFTLQKEINRADAGEKKLREFKDKGLDYAFKKHKKQLIMASEIDALKELLKDKDLEYKKLEKFAIAQNQEGVKISGELENAKKILGDQYAEGKGLLEQAQKLREEINQNINDLQIAKKRIDELSKEVNKNQNDKTVLEDKLRDAYKEIIDFGETLEKTHNEMESFRDKYRNLMNKSVRNVGTMTEKGVQKKRRFVENEIDSVVVVEHRRPTLTVITNDLDETSSSSAQSSPEIITVFEPRRSTRTRRKPIVLSPVELTGGPKKHYDKEGKGTRRML